tara:strand:- start:45 stop:1304 length:1260 start_codon:yes stop_codon:yes gene_type:complete
MAERRKTKSSNITSFGNSQVQRIHSDIHRIIDSREYDFYELEPVEVKEVLLDKNKLPKKSDGKPNYKYYGAIKGSWINNKDQQILGDGVHILPLDPQIKRYPVIGENVVCVNYLGQTYYSDIINIKNNPNNNIKTGLSNRTNRRLSIQTTDEDLAYQRNIEANQGDLVLTGRYASSIKIGEYDLTPSVQIVAGHNTDELDIDEPVKCDLNKDEASIYVQGRGGSHRIKNPNPELSDIYTKGSVIVLDADYIVLNAKEVLTQQSGELNEVIGKQVEIKHNNKEGLIFTGKTKALLANLRSGPIKLIREEIKECLKAIRELSSIDQEEYEELKILKDKLLSINIDFKGFLETATGRLRATFKDDEYEKLQKEYREAQKGLAEATPTIATDPVSFTLALNDYLKVINKFAKREFIRTDIVTD